MKLISVISSYSAGQLPEVCKRTNKSLLIGIQNALQVGQNHHKTTLEQLSTVTLYRHNDSTCASYHYSVKSLVQTVREILMTEGHGVYKVTVSHPKSEVCLNFYPIFVK